MRYTFRQLQDGRWGLFLDTGEPAGLATLTDGRTPRYRGFEQYTYDTEDEARTAAIVKSAEWEALQNS